MPEIASQIIQKGLETTNAEYDEWFPRWEKAEDCNQGEDIVKQKGEDYLPKTSLMEMLKNGKKLYEAYKERASFFNGTGRTVDGLLGLVFRRPPTFTLPENILPWKDNIDMHNKNGKKSKEAAVVWDADKIQILGPYGLTRIFGAWVHWNRYTHKQAYERYRNELDFFLGKFNTKTAKTELCQIIVHIWLAQRSARLFISSVTVFILSLLFFVLEFLRNRLQSLRLFFC